MAKDRDGNQIPDYVAPSWDAQGGAFIDPNLTKAEGAKNVSMLTGKTWEQMNDNERFAHKIARGNSDELTDAQVARGQKYLNNNAGDSNEQLLLSIAMRDAATDRMDAGIFNYGTEGEGGARDQLHRQLAESATHGGYYDDPNGPSGGTGNLNPTLGVRNSDYFDPSGLTVGGEGDEKVWNPETNAFEYYVNDDVFRDTKGSRGSYINEMGERVSGFRGGPTGTQQNGDYPEQYSFVDDANRLAAWDAENEAWKRNPVGPPPPPPPTVNPPVNPPTGTPPPDGDPYIPIDWDLLDPGAPDVPNDRTDLPQPVGGPVADWTGEGRQADTSWDWDAFAPKRVGDGAWGGYDEDYQAFERYQPGMESPWGMPDVAGGNKAFYQQQFANQLRDEQGYQNRERTAQRNRQNAIDNPLERAPDDWSWANNGKGLGQTDVSSGIPEDNRAWGLNEGFNNEMSNADVITQAMSWDSWGDKDRKRARTWLDPKSWEGGEENKFFTGGNWAKGNDPDKITANLGRTGEGLTADNRTWLNSIINGMYSKQGKLAPSSPMGYAQPLASYATNNTVNPGA